MRRIGTAVKHTLAKEVHLNYGITGLRDIKFWLVAACYAAAFFLMLKDPFFGDTYFSYKQGIVTLILAFIIVAALSWELCILGEAKGANFILQLLLCMPFAIFIARITSTSSVPPNMPDTLLSWVKEAGHFALSMSGLYDLVPDWLKDIFANWRAIIFLILVMFILSFKKLEIKIGGLVLTLLAAFLWALVQSPSIYLLPGAILLFAGTGLQYCRYDKIVIYRNIYERLRESAIDESEIRTCFRIARAAVEEGKVSEEKVKAIVKSEYSNNTFYNTAELKCIATEITRRLVYEYSILQLHGGPEGICLLINPGLRDFNMMLGYIAKIPKMLFAGMIVIGWVLMPYDIIPDAIPLAGALDDMVVTIIGAFICRDLLSPSKTPVANP